MTRRIIAIVLVLVVAAGALVYFVFFRKDEIKITTYSPGEFFVTNLRGSNKLFKVDIALILDSDKEEEFLTENNPQIRDTIIFTLRDLNEDNINDPLFHIELKNRIKDELNAKLNFTHIIDVSFNDYVMQ